MFLFLFKNAWLFVYVRIRLFLNVSSLLQSWRNNLTYFAKLDVISCLDYALLLFEPIHLKETPFLFVLGKKRL